MDEPLTTPVFHILLALADAPRHGYAIMQEVEARTGGAVRLGPGTLYGAIRRLRERGWIEEREGGDGTGGSGSSEEERRRTYRLTRSGREAARAEAGRLAALVAQARSKRLAPVEGRA